MAMTAAQRTEIIQTVVGMFGAAPGATYLSELSAYAGKVNLLVKDLANTAAFKSLYPTFLTNQEFATNFLNNLLGTSVTDTAAKDWAINWMKGMLDAGKSRGDVISEALTALKAIPTTDTTWGAAAQQFANKVTVAEYYSVTMAAAVTDLATLQSVIANVTATTDVSNPAQVIAGTPGAQTGQTFTLTTGVDNITGTSGNDTIIADNTGTSNQLTAADQVNGGGGTDTLKIYQLAATGLNNTVFGQLTSIENIYINNGTLTTTKTLDVSGLTGVESIELDSPGAMGDGDTFTLKTTATQKVALTKVVGTAGGATSTFNLNGATDVTLNGVGTDLTLDLTSTGTSLKLTTTGAASTITLANTGGALATLNIAGDKALDVTTNAGALKTVASTATGDVTLNNTGGAVETYTGGSGKDTLTLVGANVKNVATGAGNDKVTIVTSALPAAATIDLGDGNDTLTLIAGGLANLTNGSQLVGGAGTDRLVTNENAVLTAAQINKINQSSGFEELGFATHGSGVNVAQLTSINKFYVEGDTGVTLTNANNSTQVSINLDVNNTKTVTIQNAVGENSTTVAIDNQSGAGKTLTTLTLTGATNVALSSTGKAGSSNTITTLNNSDNTNLTITGNTDLTITNALAGTTVGSKVDAGTFTGKLTVIGSGKADQIIGGTGNDTITGGNGDDTIDLTKGGNDRVVFSAAAGNGKDTIKGFTVGANADTILLDKADTTVGTTNAQAAWATHGVTTVNNGSAYNLSGADIGTEAGNQTFAGSDVIELTGGSVDNADLDAATDGTELLKLLATTGTATGITVAAAGDKAFLIAYDNGKAYLYHADSGADTTIAANEITLIGVFEGVAAGGFVPANVLMS